MDKRLFCFMLACCMATVSFSATLRVSNVSGSSAPYSTISSALAAASAGDIILVEGSPNSYGDVNINKQVTIMGAGNFLVNSSNTQFSGSESLIGTITISASGVIITGMYINNNLIINGSNALIKRNRIETSSPVTPFITVSGTGAVVEQNYIRTSFYYSNCGGNVIISLGGNTNSIIRNNLIYSYNTTSGCNYLGTAIAANSSSTSIVVLQNNVIYGHINTYSSNIFNNILINGNVSGSSNTYSNNLSNSTQFAAINGNMQNVSMNSVFVTFNGALDSDYKLKANSPALNKGVGGGDCGMFSSDSGGNPYIIPNMPQAPSIYQMTIDPNTATSTIQLNIKAASH